MTPYIKIHGLFTLILGLALYGSVSRADEGSVSMSASTDKGVQTSASATPEDKEYVDHADINLHLALGYIYGGLAWPESFEDNYITRSGLGMRIALDFVFFEPFAFQLEGGYNYYAFSKDAPDIQGELEKMPDGFVGGGLRIRPLASHTPAATMDGGDAWGNLWIDAHVAYHRLDFKSLPAAAVPSRNDWKKDRGGFDVGLGYEFSIAKDFLLGPFVRYNLIVLGDGPNFDNIEAGLEFSFGMRTEPADKDKDGIPDDVDKCPDQAEDKDGFQDDDGCPDLDNDNDGIPDTADKCPNEAGPKENNGCPDTDADKDGVVDRLDKCINEPEDKDGFQDDDGCPDPDNDNDGILDADDKCPNEAGPKENNGCPDTDTDKDGVVDRLDQCPNEAGPADNNGCPKLARVEGDQIKILDAVYFATDKDKILEKSYPVLQDVAGIIKGKPDIRIRVEGHTDNRGAPKHNRTLSDRRAASVLKYMTEQGIEAGRLESIGYGPDKPIADNKTEDGRAKNRRVEFHMIHVEAAPAQPAPAAQPQQ